ncbi:MAG: hypothetical protein M3271_02735 [Actinomycetota bacterium]|nr:hypothetical protein [Actinomycetota bacterium]
MTDKTEQRVRRIEKKGGYGAGTKAVSELKPPPKTLGVGSKSNNEGRKENER